MLILVCLLLIAYFSGSIPYGLLVARAKGVDILSTGSGNIGATNVLRTLGKPLGVIVFILDILKGLLPGLLARHFITEKFYVFDAQAIWFLVGVFSVLGHIFSPWLNFKGGKGIATGFGATLCAIPYAGLAAFGCMIVTTMFTRYVSLGSLLAAWIAPIFAFFVFHDSWQVIPVLILMALFITVKHKDNIVRIKNGTERKFPS
jgi:acyl phosphate:glycerol-3-phosphate acyltransferase